MAERQLVLDLDHPPALTRADFVVGAANRDALAAIEAWPHWPAPVLLLTGPAGAGKTHLAAIWCARTGAARLAAAGLTDAAADEVGLAGAIAVEDLDRATGFDRSLFHLLNRARERGASVLLSARDPALRLGAGLPDLASRLRAAQRAELAPPDDALLTAVLVKQFADRQLAVAPSVVSYIVLRMDRSFESAAAIVRRLDEAALATGRPVTRPLAGAIMAEMFGGDGLETVGN